MSKTFMVVERSFLRGAIRHPGETITLDESEVNGKETNLAPVDGELPALPQVQVSPIAPTGPNPTMPQQVPPDARQTIGGQYVQPGQALLVSEVTQPAEVRTAGIEPEGSDAQTQLAETVAKLQAELAAVRAEQQAALARGEAPADVTPASTTTSEAQTQNDDDNLVAGTVAEITADLGGKTDDELKALRAAEVDREKPRKGVIDAIDRELQSR